MNFLKKHYEKVLLGAVLVGLLAAVLLLVFKINQERSDMEDMRNKILTKRVQPLPALDTNLFVTAEARSETPLQLSFAAPPHNLINPVRWVKTPDGAWIKEVTGRELGPERLEVTKITPLYTTISLDSYNSAGSNYLIKVERQTERAANKRNVSHYVAVGGKTETFTLLDVKGPPDKPTALGLELKDTGLKVNIAPDAPYRRIDGYMVDLKYDLEKHRPWRDERVGSRLAFAGDVFSIVSINLVATNQYEVVVSAKSTGKKTTIKYNAVP